MRAEMTTLDAASAGDIELDDRIFNLEPRQDILQRMVRWQLLKRMAGTHHTQDRSEVNVTGKKFVKHGDKKVKCQRCAGTGFYSRN